MKKYLYAVTLVLFLGTALFAGNSDLQAKSEITHAINLFLVKLDQKKFDEVEKAFTKDATNTAYFGGQPSETKTAHSIVEGWKQNLTPVQAVHHQTGNFLVDVKGTKATATFYGIASWYRPENPNPVTWFVGDYECDMVKISNEWKIAKLRYNNKFVNPPLGK